MWIIFFFRQFAHFCFFINIVINSFVSNGPLAQSVEHGANNGKGRVFEAHTDQISLFIWISFSFQVVSYIHCIKIVNLEYICSKWSASSVGRAWC